MQGPHAHAEFAIQIQDGTNDQTSLFKYAPCFRNAPHRNKQSQWQASGFPAV